MESASRRDSDLSIFTSASGTLGPFAQQQLQQAREKLYRVPSAASSRAPARSVSVEDGEIILEPPSRPFAGASGVDSRHSSAALSMRSGYASVLDGIPFNLSLSPEARHSQASSSGHGAHANPFRDSASSSTGGLPISQSQQSGLSAFTSSNTTKAPRDSTASFVTSSDAGTSSDKRDTSYSLASEWNGAFAGMPIVMGGARGSVGEIAAVPELPEAYRNAGNNKGKRDSTDTIGAAGGAEKDDRYSTDSLAMAAAVARSFNA